MVSPYYILTIGLGLAFLLGLSGQRLRLVSTGLIATAMAVFTGISLSWIAAFFSGNGATTQFFSAGFQPPFSIALQVGFHEAVITFLINLLGLMSVIYMAKGISDRSAKLGPVLLIIFMGLNMLVLTRDIFNVFVFLEITSIALAGLILFEQKEHSASAGFKYLLASSLISSLYLLGVVLVYFSTGSLYADDLGIIAQSAAPAASVAAFLMIIAVVLELKPFPANGWALDVYQGTHPATAAIISGGVATALLFVLNKILPAADPWVMQMISVIGLVTFLGSNWLGISQKDVSRMLGYSSVGQIGLVMSVIGAQNYLGDQYILIAFGLLLTHLLAKAGLFWITGLVKDSKPESLAVIRNRPLLLVVFGILLFALAGFPPFPGFFAKWELIMSLGSLEAWGWMAMILLGSLFEMVYLIRWFGTVVKADLPEGEKKPAVSISSWIPLVLFATALLVAGWYSAGLTSVAFSINYIPLLAIVVLFALDFLPAWVKNTLLMGAIAYYGYLVLPALDSFALVFGAIFIAGALITLIYGYYFKGRRPGFYPLVAMMFAGLMLLIQAKDLLSFFFAWELMTAGSYFLILRGKHSQPHAFSYMLFSFGGALLLLGGFSIAHFVTGSWDFSALDMTGPLSPLVFIMLTIGFLTKTAAIGLHIWLPGAHSEAESDVSPMVSGILLKAGVYGLIVLFLHMGHQFVLGIDLMWILSWVAVITAVGGYLLASMQEDMKRLLAYSSVGQLGVILFGLTLMSNLGWLLAISGSITHFLNKTMLFQAVGGVYSRTHDRMMYRMGGLIFRMPLTFIVVLIGIISMSGVPPLAGFAGKWLAFNAVLEKGYYLQGAGMVLAGAVAFLYLFRLIHAPFLGQLKDNLRKVKEANFWMLVPQFIIIIIIMILSAYPGTLLRPVGQALTEYFPDGALQWKDSALQFGARTAISSYGYWNGTYVMIVTIAVFATLLGIQLLIQRRNKKVGQFNIVYSAERPSTPETTHAAYNFYAHYQKAVGFLITPWATRFWNAVADFVQSVALQVRRIYTGNGQAYLIHIVLFTLICFFLYNGGF
ncbi:NAD(P)H-quinone oxidoreductase subunit 2, chloroplastic [bioreactor metagenome]|uniref:NAD(P)H-quinone oxidoreductase subunit 2, chloroplastic n=1 Tax=bioreactor metagenome TaxID=1076179 RepID=A0A644Y651_9ZZZZ